MTKLNVLINLIKKLIRTEFNPEFKYNVKLYTWNMNRNFDIYIRDNDYNTTDDNLSILFNKGDDGMLRYSAIVIDNNRVISSVYIKDVFMENINLLTEVFNEMSKISPNRTEISFENY